MKIDFNIKLSEMDGSVSENAPTLRDIAIRALVEQLPSDDRSTGEDKFKRAALAHRIHVGGAIDVAIEDVAMIKKRIGEAYSPLVVYSSWNLLEQDKTSVDA